MNAFSIASERSGWSRGTMWPASYTRRNEKLAAWRSSPAGVPPTLHVLFGAVLNSALCGQSSAYVHAELPSQLQM